MSASRAVSHAAAFAGAVAITLTLMPLDARAQAPAPAPVTPGAAEQPAPTLPPVPAPDVQPTPSAAAHDVVRLHAGAFLRGTIAEQVPGSHVVIVLITGEVRRIEAAEIAYAGPEASASPVPSPNAVAQPPTPAAAQAPDADPSTATVQFSPSRPDASFFAGIGGAPQLVCTGPCQARVPGESLRLGMSVGGRQPVPADVRLTLRDGDVVDGVYRSRRGGRLGARIVGSLALAGGVVGLALGGRHVADCKELEREFGGFGAETGFCGGGVLGGGLAFGLGLGLLIGSSAMDDEVHVSVRGRPDAARAD